MYVPRYATVGFQILYEDTGVFSPSQSCVYSGRVGCSAYVVARRGPRDGYCTCPTEYETAFGTWDKVQYGYVVVLHAVLNGLIGLVSIFGRSGSAC